MIFSIMPRDEIIAATSIMQYTIISSAADRPNLRRSRCIPLFSSTKKKNTPITAGGIWRKPIWIRMMTSSA